MTSEITFIGLGNMGAALVRALLKAGRKVTIWNRTASRPSVSELVQAGATYEANLAAAIAKSPTTMLCIMDYGSIHQILDPIAGANANGRLFLKDKTLINFTNGTPQDARDMDQWMRRHGAARYIDCGIMVMPPAIGTPVSVILLSGETETVFHEPGIKDVLTILGRPHYFGSDPGAAAAYDLALLAGMFGMFSGAVTAMSLMQKQLDRQPEHAATSSSSISAGPDPTQTQTPTLQSRVATFLNPFLNMLMPFNVAVAGAVDNGKMDDHFGDPMDMMHIAVRNVLRACDEEGVDGASLKYFADLMETVVDQRGGDVGLGWMVPLLIKKK